MKRGERPGESRAGDTAVHHWIFPDIRGVIESDELMPDHLRINRECQYGETDQDEGIRSVEFYCVANRDAALSFRRCNKSSFSFSCCSFGHLFATLTNHEQPSYLRCLKTSKSFVPLIRFVILSEAKNLGSFVFGTEATF